MKKIKILINILIGIAALVAISIFINFLFSGTVNFNSLGRLLTTSLFGVSVGLAYWLGNWAIGAFVVKNLNWKKNPQKANTISLLAFIIYGIIISPLVPFLFQRFVWHSEGKQLYYDVLINAFIGFSIDMIFVSIYYTISLSKSYKNAIIQNEQLKHENLLAKYEALKNQVDPHFLFNSLNTLSGVIEQKPEQATTFVKKLSEIYRYVLELQNKEVVALSEEMNFVNDYIYLVKNRFGESLHFTTNIDDGNKVLVVPLALQMLAENAIKHNIISEEAPLNLEMNMHDNYIEVKNNLQKKKTIEGSAKPVGLENLKNRYAYLCDKEIEVNEKDGFFLVRIPVIKNEEYELSGD